MKKSCSGASLLLLLLPSIHEKTIYGVNVMGAIRKLFSYWFSLKWEENGAAFFFGGNFALFSCGNSTAQTTKNVWVKSRFCEKVTKNLCNHPTFLEFKTKKLISSSQDERISS